MQRPLAEQKKCFIEIEVTWIISTYKKELTKNSNDRISYLTNRKSCVRHRIALKSDGEKKNMRISSKIIYDRPRPFPDYEISL